MLDEIIMEETLEIEDFEKRDDAAILKQVKRGLKGLRKAPADPLASNVDLIDNEFDELEVKSLDLTEVTDLRQWVDTYYRIQQLRLAFEGTTRAFKKLNRDYQWYEYLAAKMKKLEDFSAKNISVGLDRQDPVAGWLLSLKGVGPIYAAGLISNIDYSMVNSVGRLQQYCGYTTSAVRKKGQKLNYNPWMKSLLHNIGKSFVFSSNRPDCFYGQLYKEFKADESKKNTDGRYADLAAQILASKNFAKGTAAKSAYQKGVLPAAHIVARAQRRMLKVFIAHLAEVIHEATTGEEIVNPYVFAHLQHKDRIEVPNWDGIRSRK